MKKFLASVALATQIIGISVLIFEDQLNIVQRYERKSIFADVKKVHPDYGQFVDRYKAPIYLHVNQVACARGVSSKCPSGFSL